MIKIENLSKGFRTEEVETTALNNVSLEVKKGEFVAIMGPSGSGQTTLMNIVGCLDQATSGRLILDGQDISKCSDNQMSDIRLQKIGFVFQNFQLLARQSAMENVCLPLTYAGVPKKERRERAAIALERVGLGDRMSFKPTQLSGGQKQRLSIARALVKKPEILILDDSSSALDFATDAKLRKAVHNLEGNTTTFLVSQRIAGIRQADQILVLGNGTLEGNNTHDELMKTCEVYREIYFSQFPEERAAYNNESGVIA